MTSNTKANPAELEAEKALAAVKKCLNERKNFRVEAGAGAGKTYSLVDALKFIIEEMGPEFERRGQKVACISFTNAATDEITSRTDGHSLVTASTLHSFFWSLICNFQPFLRGNLQQIEHWVEKLEAIGGIGQKCVKYDLGHARANPDDCEVYVGHDDVIALTVLLLKEEKFRSFMTAQYPILLIDEYQDTNEDLAAAIVQHFLDIDDGPLIGLFGDSWQKIYDSVCGAIEHRNLEFIGKQANFRSTPPIVDVLNRIRPDLKQKVKDPLAEGSVAVYHTNDWVGARRTGSHWKGDLPAKDASECLRSLRLHLENEGWDFAPEYTKVLMLTHNVLATEQNYSGIFSTFRYNDSFIKKENSHIQFLVDKVEPACIAYEKGKYGEMLTSLGEKSLDICTRADKTTWVTDMAKLLKLRRSGTIGEVLSHLRSTQRPRVPEKVAKRENQLLAASQEEIDESRSLQEIKKLQEVKYSEIVSLAQFLDSNTPFSTKHSVKGLEFENVLVVLGRGWNHYNWNKFLENAHNAPKGDQSYEKNRNLFYVACSRPKTRLCVFFTQELSDEAMTTLTNWFGSEVIHSVLDV